jgi:hypothetical protein
MASPDSPGDISWERQSPDWRLGNRQSGDWRSQGEQTTQTAARVQKLGASVQAACLMYTPTDRNSNIASWDGLDNWGIKHENDVLACGAVRIACLNP